MNRFSCLLFLSLFTQFVFSEDLGECHLTQDSVTGEYTIVCSGGSSSGTFTNCVELKQELLQGVDSISGDLRGMGQSLGRDYMNASNAWGNYLPNMDYYNEWSAAVNACQDVVDTYQRRLYDYADNVQTGDLYKAVSSIQCVDCSDGDDSSSGGSCTCNVNVDVDLSEIINLMNEAQSVRVNIYSSLGTLTNIFSTLNSLTSYVGPYNNSGVRTVNYYESFLGRTGSLIFDSNTLYLPSTANQRNLLSQAVYLGLNFANSQASLNNYAHYLMFQQLPRALDVFTNSVPSFIDKATNFYSQTLFENTAVLGAYSSVASPGQSYHDFLTNYYIKAVTGRISDFGSGGLYKQTNWFARVEALIAALVFTDDESTNTVGVYDGQFDSVVQGATELPSVAVSRLSVFSDTSSSLVSSLRSLGNTFSSVADPGSVVLFNLPGSSSSVQGEDSIGFETSELRNFIDICRNVTTLAWVSVGLIFLFRFVFWTVRTSYSLVVFSWGVLSSIFQH